MVLFFGCSTCAPHDDVSLQPAHEGPPIYGIVVEPPSSSSVFQPQEDHPTRGSSSSVCKNVIKHDTTNSAENVAASTLLVVAASSTGEAEQEEDQPSLPREILGSPSVQDVATTAAPSPHVDCPTGASSPRKQSQNVSYLPRCCWVSKYYYSSYSSSHERSG